MAPDELNAPLGQDKAKRSGDARTADRAAADRRGALGLFAPVLAGWACSSTIRSAANRWPWSRPRLPDARRQARTVRRRRAARPLRRPCRCRCRRRRRRGQDRARRRRAARPSPSSTAPAASGRRSIDPGHPRDSRATRRSTQRLLETRATARSRGSRPTARGRSELYAHPRDAAGGQSRRAAHRDRGRRPRHQRRPAPPTRSPSCRRR